MELIQAEDIANTEMATQKSKTKRNTYVQTWRRCKRYERRQAAFVQEYVETKYHAIYDEVMEVLQIVKCVIPRQSMTYEKPKNLRNGKKPSWDTQKRKARDR